jgi:hypothetical protein
MVHLMVWDYLDEYFTQRWTHRRCIVQMSPRLPVCIPRAFASWGYSRTKLAVGNRGMAKITEMYIRDAVTDLDGGKVISLKTSRLCVQ